ncbi:MAG TPA: hypothetical protein VFS18_02590 [Actinomycetota bacterium]|nr:hypothetical protein [Actinomycetota bacterium]
MDLGIPWGAALGFLGLAVIVVLYLVVSEWLAGREQDRDNARGNEGGR